MTAPTAVTVPARDVRMPQRARDALDQHEPVTVVAYKRSQYVLLHPDDYAIVSSMLECYRSGRPIPVEKLLTEDDFAIIREEFSDGVDEGILEAWVA